MSHHCHRYPYLHLMSVFTSAAVAAVALSACHAPGGASPMNTDASERTIELKERPDPQRAYRIVMTIRDAPGPFVVSPGSTQHDIVNLQECGRINPNTGMAFHINAHPQFEWEKISDTEYQGIIYAEKMLDEDYFGRGVCRWSFTFANASLSATGDERETRFQPKIRAEEIAAGQAVTWYFWKQRYLIATPLPSTGKGIADFGQRNLDDVPVEKRSEFLSITLVSTEIEP
jgi:hypothetical protein